MAAHMHDSNMLSHCSCMHKAGHQSGIAPIIVGYGLNMLTGRQRPSLAGASFTTTSTPFPPFSLPGGSDTSGAHSSGAVPPFPRRLQGGDPPMGPQGWSRPFSPQPLYPAGPAVESPLPLAVFCQGADQVSNHTTFVCDQPVCSFIDLT